MKFGVVQFPGSNCDADAFHAVSAIVRQPVEFIWHQSEDLAGCDVVILPGGFAFGDYLRTGAIARFSPVMKAVERFARGGGLVLGICNGFQILLEAGLLPGAMMRNQGAALSVPAGAYTGGGDGYAVYMRCDARTSAGRFRSRTMKEIIFASRRRWRSWSVTTRLFFITCGRMAAMLMRG